MLKPGDCRKVNLEQVYQNIHQDLIEGCRNGDAKSQLNLYKLYYKAMYNTAMRIVNDAMEAEDLMQDAFLDAFGKIHSYKGEASFGAWLKKIVVNKCINWVNRRKLVTESIEEKGDFADDQVEEERVIIDMDEVKQSIEELPDGYRIILSLYLIEGFDHEEIAQIMNITSSTSRSQYTRAKSKLKQLLQTKNYAE